MTPNRDALLCNRSLLLAAIIANPDDDLVRLVWADCVEEEGDADRAEFVRVQIELAKHPRRLKTVEPFVLRSAGPNYWTTSSCGRTDDGMLIQCVKPGDRVDVDVYGEDTRKRKKGAILHGLRFLKFTGEDDEDAVLVRDAESVRDPSAELRRRERELRGRMVGVGNYELEKATGIDGGWSYVWSRGFLSAVTCLWEDWQRHADSLVWWPAKKCERCEGTAEWSESGREVDAQKCPHCVKGEIPGATMECPECIDVERNYPPEMHGCVFKACKGTGRVPRPMPATAQPIVEVTFTTEPDLPIYTLVAMPDYLKRRWPPVRKWNLPPTSTSTGPPPTS